MRRALALLTLTVATALPAAALAKSKHTHHFTDHLLGALIRTQGSKSTYAFDVSTSDVGNGASVTVNTSTSSTGGKTRAVLYFATGSIRSSGSYKIVSTAPNGVITFTVSGHERGATGAFKGATGKFHGTGIYDPKTSIVTLTVTGTITD